MPGSTEPSLPASIGRTGRPSGVGLLSTEQAAQDALASAPAKAMNT
jgi:hypothetical protein